MLLDAAAMTDEERIAIAGMKRSGVKAKDIAKRFGISAAMVAKVARECGARCSLDGSQGIGGTQGPSHTSPGSLGARMIWVEMRAMCGSPAVILGNGHR